MNTALMLLAEAPNTQPRTWMDLVIGLSCMGLMAWGMWLFVTKICN